MLRRALLVLAVVASHGVLQVSCDAGDGGDLLRISDASHTGCSSPEETLAAPIAAGARLAVKAADSRGQPPIESAESSDTDILTVETVENPVLIRAQTPGEATLAVHDTAGRPAMGPLSVAEVASVTAELDELLLYNLDVGLQTRHTATAAGILGAGVALLPDGVLRVTPVFRGADGTALLGHDLASWSATPAALSWTYPEPYLDTIDVSSNGTAEGTVTLTEGGGSVLEVTLHPAGAAASMGAYWPETGELSGALTLAVGEVRTVVGVVRDADGRLIVGDDGAPLTAEPTGENVRVVPPPWSEGEDAVALTLAMEALLLRVRATWIEGVYAGTTEVVLSAAGVSLSVSVTITE